MNSELNISIEKFTVYLCIARGLYNYRTVYMHGGRVNNSVFATMYTAPIERAVSQKLLVAIRKLITDLDSP